MVRKPNRRSGCRRCLPSRFFCKDRRAVTALGKNDATGKSRYARANNCDGLIHSTLEFHAPVQPEKFVAPHIGEYKIRKVRNEEESSRVVPKEKTNLQRNRYKIIRDKNHEGSLNIPRSKEQVIEQCVQTQQNDHQHSRRRVQSVGNIHLKKTREHGEANDVVDGANDNPRPSRRSEARQAQSGPGLPGAACR
jgi:hypothetical protein